MSHECRSCGYHHNPNAWADRYSDEEGAALAVEHGVVEETYAVEWIERMREGES